MRLALVTLLLLSPTLSAFAQTFEQTTALRLHEAPMGARTAAMGGASEALTPDGTDLASNPSLIASLKKPVLSLSGAQTSYSVVRLSTDTNAYSFRHVGREARALSHVAAVIPLHGFVVGVYARQEPRMTDGIDGIPPTTMVDYQPQCPIEPCIYAYGIGATAFSRDDRRYGVTAAVERGRLSLGAGAELQDLDESYDIWRIALPGIGFMERVTRRTSARKVVPNAGVRFRVSPRVALAAAYNGAASRERADTGCIGDWTQSVCISPSVPLGATSMRGADAYRASVTVAPAQNLVVVAEGVRRNYGKVVADDPVFVSQYRDTTELRAGAEYRLHNTPVALRAGWWREPANIASFFYQPAKGALTHRTIGAGIDVGSSARVDVAYDDADDPSQSRAIVGVAFRTGH